MWTIPTTKDDIYNYYLPDILPLQPRDLNYSAELKLFGYCTCLKNTVTQS